jgi:hypothetical protein
MMMKKKWTLEELKNSWTIHSHEAALILKKTKNNRLGFALMLKCFQLYSVFPTSVKDIAKSVFDYVAQQLDNGFGNLKSYKWNQRTAESFRREIRDYLGIREFKEDDRYEIAVLKSLREKLRCKEIWVTGANRYRNPDKDLPSNFEERREEYYKSLNKPLEAENFIEKLQKEMKEALKMLDKGVATHEKVRILSKKGGYISLSPLEAQDPPPNLEAIKKQILEKWPTIGLLDILKEAEFRTDFISCFSSTASREYLDFDQLKKRLLLSVFAYGTNTGLKRISASNPDVTYEELRYVRRRFMTKENVKAAIITVVNALGKFRDEVQRLLC